jgi:hypothetical protein
MNYMLTSPLVWRVVDRNDVGNFPASEIIKLTDHSPDTKGFRTHRQGTEKPDHRP